MLRKLSSLRLKPPDGGEPWPLLLAISISLSLVSRFLFGLFDGTEALTQFRDRAIGQTTLVGVDVSGYVRNYIAMTALFAVSFFLVFVLLSWLDKALRKRIDARLIGKEYSLVQRLSELSIVLFMLKVILKDDFLTALNSALYHFIFLIFLLIAVRIAIRRRGAGDGVLAALLADGKLLVAVCFLPFPFLYFYWVLAGERIGFDGYSTSGGFGLYALAVALILAALYGVARKGGRRTDAVTRRLVLAAAPLVLVPVSVPLANELQYGFPDTPPRSVSLGLMAFLALASLLLVLLQKKTRLTAEPAALIHNFYFPTFIATAALYKLHRQVSYYGDLDYFHLGEITVPTQQLFNFSSIPLIDIRLAHTLSDMFYQTLYTLINGYHGLDMLIWRAWMPELLALLIIYFFVARLVSPVFAVLVTSLAPVLGAVTAYYSFALLPPIFLYGALRRPTWRRFALVWAAAIGLILWRIDFGLVGGVSLLLVLAVYTLRRPARLKPLAVSLAVVTAACLGALALFAFLSHRPAVETLAFMVKSYSYRLATRTRPEIIREYSTLAVLQYYVLPFLSLTYILYFAVQRLVRNRFFHAGKYMLAFVAIFSLIISLRSLERHSLIEVFNPHLAVLLLASVPFLVRDTVSGREGPASRALFLGVLVVNVLFVLPPSTYSKTRPGMQTLFRSGKPFELRDWSAGEKRVFYNVERHADLVRFLDDRLEGDQTFYDFTNSPLLYTLADKRFPTYVIPNMIQTSEGGQAEVLADLEELHAQGRLPFVVFKQGNRYWDNVDDVPNEVRSYRITEFIYENYLPLANVDKYQVWCERTRPDPQSLLTDYSATYALDPGPDFESNNLTATVDEDSGSVTLRAASGDPYVKSLYPLDELPPTREYEYWSLHLEYRSSAAGQLQVFSKWSTESFREDLSSGVEIHETGESFRELVVPVKLSRRPGRLEDLRFDPPAGSTLTVRNLSLRGDEIAYDLNPEAGLVQRFELLKLPFIWGNYDPLSAVTSTEVQARLLDGPVALAAGEELSLPLDPALDKSAGTYLHLRIRPQVPPVPAAGDPAGSQDVRVSVEYGEEPRSLFRFTVFSEPDESQERYPMAERADYLAHNLDSFVHQGRTIYQATGDDPYVHQALVVDGVPPLAANRRHYLHLKYRVSVAGRMQVFFGFDWHWFENEDSVELEARRTAAEEKPREVMIPLPPRGGSPRLTDRRFDPPDHSLFEVVEAAVISGQFDYDDYLVRLSTQWQWVSGPIGELRLTASAPVAFEQVSLRKGD